MPITKLKPVLWIASLLLMGAAVVYAQDICTANAPDALAAFSQACVDAPVNSLCSADGTITALDALTQGDTSGAPQTVPLSGSAEGAQIDVTVIGGAAVTAYAQSASLQVDITNRAGFNVNLRGGPGSNFDVVGIFHYDDHLLADGKSADGQWLRVVRDNGIAWVGIGLVAIDPALDSLPIVTNDSSTLNGHALTIAPPEAPCAEIAPAVIVSASGDAPERVTINEVPLTLINSSAWVNLTDTGLLIYALGSGSVGIGIGNPPLDSGDVIAWNAQTGELETLDSVPPLPALSTVSALPPGAACVIGLETADASVETLTYPTEGSDPVGQITGTGGVIATEQHPDGDVQWLHIASSFGGGWVPAAEVISLSTCTDLPEAAAASTAPISAVGAGLSPDQIMMNYLNARVTGDGGQMQALACAAYDSQAVLQSQAFRAMRAELMGVTCTTIQQAGGSAVVHCDGTIQTEYNGEFRQWTLGNYAMSQENGAWRVCGEAN